MRFVLGTRHRLVVILTGDDARAATEDEDTVEAVVDNSGGSFEPAIGFCSTDQPVEDE